MPHTGTTLCHPKIGYVNTMPLFRKRHLALNSPLGHLNGDNANSPPDTRNYTVTLKLKSPHTSDDTRCHLNLLNLLITQFRLNKHNLCMSLAAPKANPIFHAANKNLFIKIYFDLRHLIFIILPLFTLKT